MLTPVLALVLWTLIVWLWMYATRIPAMKAANISPQEALHPGSLSALPVNVRVVADNYNHLHEAPTIFYALAIYTHLAGAGDLVNIWFAWGYVVLRIVHSLIQIVVRQVPLRFFVFLLSTACLMVIAVRDLLAL
ncbi:MAG: MAPEG family protein [Parvularculaceae bacterium]|nr:MAPEG family protein [Parvularculaceae bacterium]